MIELNLAQITYLNLFLSTENIAPSLIANPEDAIAIPGSNVTLFCITNGYPKPTVSWEKDGSVLNGKHFTISTNGALHIMGATESRDKGIYRCISSNVVGTIVSLPAKLGFPCKFKREQIFFVCFCRKYSKLYRCSKNIVCLNSGLSWNMKFNKTNNFPKLIYAVFVLAL